MATTSFPTDKQLPNTDNIIRQTDCSYSFQKEAVSLTLKFMGDVKEAVGLAAAYRAGTRVAVSDLTGKFTELNNVLPTSQLEASGKVTASTSTTKTGSGTVSITVQVPYKTKIAIGSGDGSDPEKRIITTWSEKSTDYEFPLEIYAGEGQSASEANAGNLEAWKQERMKNIQNYKEFKYSVEGESEPVELEGRTLDLAKKIYEGIESVRRAYPEVIRTTQYLNYKADEDSVDDTLIKQITRKPPNLYYRDQTPHEIWKSLFDNFDWLKSAYDVNCEPTEYQKLWNITVTECWMGCDKDEKGAWDDDLYGADGTRWKFASAQNQAQANVDGNPVNGNGRVNPTTFQNQKDIKKLDLNNAYTAVDANSFKANPTRGTRSASTGIPDLETITMPSVSFIGDDAFNGAANLKSINLTNQITYMGERVFQGCTSMTEAIVEPWIYELPASTFEGCTSLNGSQGGTFTVGGLVKTIGVSAFKDCTSLTSVSCENAITSVGDNAFENDAALTSFSMGLDSTGSITLGDEAFKGCEALADIELPVPTITVGTDTFDGAFDDEVTVKAPKSFLSNLLNTSSYNYIYPAFVTSIAQEEFRDDSKLKSVVIPSTITSIGNNSFRAPNLESAVFSASVTESGTSIFQGCSHLTSLVIDSETLTTLNNNFAVNCSALTDVTITSPLTTLSNGSTSSGVFRGCSSLTDIDFLPETVESIGIYAFSNCTGLTSADLPISVTSLANGVFVNCTALKTVTLPENEQGTLTLGSSVFNGCSALERVDLPVGTLTVGSTTFSNALASECWIKAPFNSNLVGSIPSGKLVNYIYPSWTTSIASGEWQNNTKLKSATIPDGVTSIGGNAFNGCSNLDKFVCDDATTWCSKSFGASWLVGTYWDLYEGSEKVTNLTLGGAPSARCFYRNKSLVNVTIPEGVTSSGASSFEACQNLTTVTLPSTLTTIPQYSFHACPALTTINIPSGVTSIGTMALRNCTSLTTLTIPSATTTIDANAFQYMGPTGSSVEVTMEGKTTTDVQGMTNYPWGLRSGSTIHCTDADITVS